MARMTILHLIDRTYPSTRGVVAEFIEASSLGLRNSGEEVADCRCDLGGMRLQREVSGIEEADDCRGDVALEGFGACRQEKRVVLAPHRQKRRPMRAEVFLE